MTYCETYPLSAAQLKIQGREILGAIGFDKSWLVGARFCWQCLTSSDLDGLTHLLDQVDEHNHLVSAIETDIQRAAAKEKDLDDAIQTFFQTKEKIMRAIARYSSDAHSHSSDATESMVDPMSCNLNNSGGVYSWLIRKSFNLGIEAQIAVHPSV